MNVQSRWAQLLQSARQALNPSLQHPAPGLYTYPVSLNGGRRRVHLRVGDDGTGVLFIDVTEVIHLNATAVQMVRLALDQVPLREAEAQLARHYRGVARHELETGHRHDVRSGTTVAVGG